MKTTLPRRSWRRTRGERGEHRANETACEVDVAEEKDWRRHSTLISRLKCIFPVKIVESIERGREEWFY